jgi:penicillin-binding protein 2
VKPIVVKNFTQERALFQRRILAAICFIGLLILLLIVRLFYLQILQHKYFVTLSDRNHLQLLPIEPNRGLIFDRKGVLLAEDIPVFSLDIIPDQVDDLDETVSELQKIIAISDDDIAQFNTITNRQRDFLPASLKVNLTEEEAAKFYLNQYRFPGVTINPHMVRYYPLANATVSAVGYVGRINIKELKQLDATNYSASNFIGKTGIEGYYEKELHGKVGYAQVEIDASGHALRNINYVPPVHGNNIYLTIDSALQQVADQALGDENGAVVAISPKTGEILAMVSHASFDPNIFVKGISHADLKQLHDAQGRPLYNRTIKGRFPIASTIKPYFALAGLDNNVISPDYKYYDHGWFKLPNASHIYHGWDFKLGGHGFLNVTKAIICSSDPFFFNLASLLGINRMADMLTRFGFGQLTGIDVPGELSGVVATPEWKMKAYGMSWYPGDTINAGIGQGFMQATPIELASAVSTIANRGLRFKPHLLLAMQSPNSNLVTQQPTPETPVVLNNPKNWDIVINAMQGVINSTNPWGTGRNSFGINPKYTIAAKTGTGQVYSKHGGTEDANSSKIAKNLRNDSLFIAFAPVDDPKIAIAVVVEHSELAGVVARKVFDYYLIKENKNTAPQTAPAQTPPANNSNNNSNKTTNFKVV